MRTITNRLVLVRHQDGAIDLQSSEKAFRKEARLLIKEEKAINQKYKKTIKEVFKKYPKGTIITKPALVAMACQLLGATVETWRKMVKECEYHVRINRNGYLRVRPGFHGGVSLRKKKS